MSRSRRATPIVSVASGAGMAQYKRQRARCERARLTCALKQLRPDDDGAGLAGEFARWDEWDCPRDGKQFLDRPGRRDLGK